MSRTNQMLAKFSLRGSCRAARLSATAVAGFVAVMLMASAAAHVQVYWSTSAGDWSVGSNWSGGHVPTSTGNAWIVNGGTANVTTMNATCGTLSLGGSAGSGTVLMSAGSLSSPNSVGSLSPLYEYVGNAGPGTFVQSGGRTTSAINMALTSTSVITLVPPVTTRSLALVFCTPTASTLATRAQGASPNPGARTPYRITIWGESGTAAPTALSGWGCSAVAGLPVQRHRHDDPDRRDEQRLLYDARL